MLNRLLRPSVLLGFASVMTAVTVLSASPVPVWSAQAPAPTAAEPLSAEELEARATFEMVCGSCHEAAIATTTLRTREELAELLDMMVSFGASASDAQFMQVQRYLGRRYGRVNVNRAPADELQFVLDISPAVAQAMLEYRSTMRFTSAEDLKSIPGLTAARVEAFKAHLQF